MISRARILCIFFVLTPSALDAQTQMELSQNSAQTYKEADKKLNSVYQTIFAKYKDAPRFIAKLKASQRLWLQFRNAELAAMYPEPSDYYGTFHPVCTNQYLTKLTNERIKTLQQWLDGCEEGDPCSGSVKLKSEVGQ
jgi:uncharacterized protein YecT (DUF1311 family)